ncbi:MAG: preprotein translocase subunit SecG [Ignavibacteriales bacterium]|nr:preprotein translocase subunit SecG [Ignavibacteriales bacterium]MBI3788187.1 preprotein translocase subunit SecG [Ignavibacteriales bacterium]
MYTFSLVVEIIVSILLIIVVLMQASKGGGLAGSLGGSNLGTTFGVRRTSDFLTRTTTILATVFVALALFINLVVLPKGEKIQESVIQSSPQQTSLPPVSQPAATPSTTPPAQNK